MKARQMTCQKRKEDLTSIISAEGANKVKIIVDSEGQIKSKLYFTVTCILMK